MFENQIGQAEAGSMKACRPDPEDLLQQARKKLEECDMAEKLLFDIDALSITVAFNTNHNGDAMMIALGSIAVQRKLWQQEEQRWLAEIDKEYRP